MKNKTYQLLPNLFQNVLASIFNILAYQKRYRGVYKVNLKKFKNNRELSLEELKNIQQDRFLEFLQGAIKKSKFYSSYKVVDLNNISSLPIIQKEDIRKNIKDIYTITKAEGIVSKTGGTTGKSLEVLYKKENMQERFAMLDDFRNRFGYKLGKKTAWFSGKSLLTQRDIKKNRFWKTDYYHRVRYYSTFHIKNEYLKYYVENIIKFQPEYLVGFPSTMLDIAKYGLQNGYTYPHGVTKAIFPTAETITPDMRKLIEQFFQSKMYNQYASFEGAPFIFECKNENLHLELQSGVFEVLDENSRPTNSGRLVVTSFTTEGTPLIRYDIGDSITLEDKSKVCICGNNNPLVKEVLGRIDDYIYSPENGKINLGNVSNTLKDTVGILKFQAVQNSLEKIELYVIVDENYSKSVQKKFIQNWKDRVGSSVHVEIKYVDSIENEKSGKFRIVKNNIKHLLN